MSLFVTSTGRPGNRQLLSRPTRDCCALLVSLAGSGIMSNVTGEGKKNKKGKEKSSQMCRNVVDVRRISDLFHSFRLTSNGAGEPFICSVFLVPVTSPNTPPPSLHPSTRVFLSSSCFHSDQDLVKRRDVIKKKTQKRAADEKKAAFAFFDFTALQSLRRPLRPPPSTLPLTAA